jgi:predicted kinase
MPVSHFIRTAAIGVHDAPTWEECMKSRILMVVAALGLSVSLVGCKNDCRVACEKKQECVSSNLNVDQCAETCGRKAKEDKEFASQAQACSQCVKDRACSETMRQCLDECIGVVGL